MNVILMTSDQQRYDSLGINGSSFVKTPNLDRLGREGAVFERAYCPNTICTPSRVSMMTGQYLSRHGAYNIGCLTPETDTFLSHVLRKNGFQTHHIGKAHWNSWQNEQSVEYHGMDITQCAQPFTDFFGFDTAELSIGHGAGGITAHYAHWVQEKGYDPQGFAIHPLFEKDPNQTAEWDLPVDLHSGWWIAERVTQFLETRNPDKPFFLNLGFPDPHHPHILPSDYTNRIDPADIPLPAFDEKWEQDPAPHIALFRNDQLQKSNFRGQFEMAGQGPTYWGEYCRHEEKLRATRAYYYGMIQLMDEQIGTILDTLERLQLTEDTMIIFTSDHGEMLGEHHICQKGPLAYEGVTHIPLLIRYPSQFSQRTVQDNVSLVDLPPTILDFAHIEDETKRDGLSLAKQLIEGEPLNRNGVRVEYKEEPDRIRYKLWVTKEWKLAIYLNEDFGELYNLSNDPGEFINLFHNPKYKEVKYKLLLELLHDMERSEPLHPRFTRV